MAIKDILTITDLNGDQTASKVAVEFARQAGAHATGLALAFEPIVPGFLAAPMPTDYLQVAKNQAIDAAKTSTEKFKGYAELAGISTETRVEEIVTGGSLESIMGHCRLSDMVVIGQDNPEAPEPMREMLIEGLLFESGVPTLIVPFISKGDFTPKKVVVAWDGSATAARAVHAALPILEMAEQVTIVIVNKGLPLEGEPGSDIATYLARHDLEINVDVINNPPIGVGDALLNYVSENAVDLLVMGGYGHSRMREYLVGGATRDILHSMTIPVLMAH
ncbi:Universal stress protein family protein [Pseudovibrio denitrificans]|uniref:Universal stress protein family protein n=2 Tax=Pseudovibrio TaxID=258255 RepID=A0A1I7C237_9HYPH|nr:MULTISPECIES: universal stress protein [Pseudovibrio]EEA92484.1 UspA [Pseudovibrio sp. JE062]QUS56776.1 universal stress protein [Pseudovibrio brasiliensis]SFT93512.1 Universal stress protein family protein [Pseudovibrio denitrificans]